VRLGQIKGFAVFSFYETTVRVFNYFAIVHNMFPVQSRNFKL